MKRWRSHFSGMHPGLRQRRTEKLCNIVCLGN
nr:MAG TPA: hypothetical protein [Caudoviricetes sp.]